MNIELKRQVIHGSGVLTILLLQIFGKTWSAIFFFMGFMFFAIWAQLRKSKVNLGPLTKIEQYMMNQLKTYERTGEYFKGVIMFILGILLATVLFPLSIAAACIAVLSVCDSVSTLIGTTWGKHKLHINRNKSWEGSIAFFISAFCILWLFDPSKAIFIAPLVTVVEMLPRLDDNLTIPLAVGILFII